MKRTLLIIGILLLMIGCINGILMKINYGKSEK